MGGRKPKQLSGGQQQRVALARALVNHPKVLLLDEPLGALDLKLRKAMQVELKSLQEHVGITFIYVTHDQEEALTMSDRIRVMNQGEILQIGTPSDVYELPNSRFVSDFIGGTNYLSAGVVDRHGDKFEMMVAPDFRLIAENICEIEVGSRVSVAFRPGKAWIGEEPQSEHNHVRGKIIEIVYTGSITSYLIEIPGEQVLTIRQQNISSGSVNYRINDPVTITWPISSTKIFTEVV